MNDRIIAKELGKLAKMVVAIGCPPNVPQHCWHGAPKITKKSGDFEMILDNEAVADGDDDLAKLLQKIVGDVNDWELIVAGDCVSTCEKSLETHYDNSVSFSGFHLDDSYLYVNGKKKDLPNNIIKELENNNFIMNTLEKKLENGELDGIRE